MVENERPVGSLFRGLLFIYLLPLLMLHFGWMG